MTEMSPAATITRIGPTNLLLPNDRESAAKLLLNCRHHHLHRPPPTTPDPPQTAPERLTPRAAGTDKPSAVGALLPNMEMKIVDVETKAALPYEY